MSRAGILALLVPLTLVVGGCGGVGQPDPYDASGIDGLVIPTPSPDPADFVEGVDNPWLPLAPGSTWRYEARAGDEVVDTREVEVLRGTRTVAGVEATTVREIVRDADGRVVGESREWLAQDRDGNVWLLGEESAERSWEAGDAGATAGLAMPATPRIGDGYQTGYLAGEVEDRVRVIDTDAARATAYDDWDDLVETEESTPLDPDDLVRSFHARGVGLVLQEQITDGVLVELVEHAAGD